MKYNDKSRNTRIQSMHQFYVGRKLTWIDKLKLTETEINPQKAVYKVRTKHVREKNTSLFEMKKYLWNNFIHKFFALNRNLAKQEIFEIARIWTTAFNKDMSYPKLTEYGAMKLLVKNIRII